MKKRIICRILLMLLVVTALCGCGAEETSAADAYLDIAQGYVDDGNYSAAMSALKKGYEATGDSRIAVLMADLAVQMNGAEETEATEAQTEAPTEPPTEAPTGIPADEENTHPTYTQYNGSWAEAGAGWEQGGMLMDLECTEETVTIKLSYVQGQPMSRIAEFEVKEPLANIRDDALTVKFVEDSWGNKVTVHFYFIDPDKIQCYVSDVIPSDTAAWGFYVGVFDLCRYDAFQVEDSYDTEPQTPSYPIQIDMQDMLSANILGYTFFGAYEGGEISLSDWMFLYVHGCSDPQIVYKEFWYDESLDQMTYYGIYYQQAEAAGWGDIWLAIVNGR